MPGDSGCEGTAHGNFSQSWRLKMLVLSRKLNEKIVIDGNITITVVKIDRNQVRLGIEAPGQIPVYREEILPIALREARDAQALAVCS
jgi:carbon storage regulator